MKALSAEYALLVLCALAGFGGLSAFLVILVGTIGLLTRSWPKYLALWERAREVDRLGGLWQVMAVSVMNAFVAALASYAMGLVLRLLQAEQKAP